MLIGTSEPLMTAEEQAADTVRPVKHCACCGALYDLAAWKRLPLVGAQDWRELGLDSYELRLCTCRSTIALVEAA